MTKSQPPAAPTIPHSRQAEEAVIGAVLINPEEAFPLACGFLNAADFYIHRHRWVWEAFIRLREKGAPIDILTVSDELDNAGKLAEIGGSAYLTSLINQVPTSLHAEQYARIVAGHAVRVRMITTAGELARLAYDESIDVTTALNETEKLVRNLTACVSDSSDPILLDRVISDIYDRAEKRVKAHAEGKPIQSQRVKTHLADLDKILKGGFRPGGMYVVAGRPGQGKSSLLNTLTYNASIFGCKNILAASVEMTNPEVAGRLLSIDTGVEADVFLEKIPGDEEWGRLTKAMEKFSSRGKVLLMDLPGLTPARLRSKSSRAKTRFGLDLLIVDYLQLMRPGIRANNREQEVAHISRELKILAGELEVPVLVAAQLSRAVEQRSEKRPQLSDLRESGAIENDADVVMFIWRPDEIKNPNVSQVCVEKQRGGPVGVIDLYFRSQITKFESLKKKGG